MVFEQFENSLRGPDMRERLREGLIGEGMSFTSPFGEQKLIYADYTASGRALRQVESFMLEQVLPVYANSHTGASYCGASITRLRQQARHVIARLTGADADCSVIFTGAGATSAINRLVSLSGVPDVPGAIVYLGPYEHHSNILPWRESGARVIEIPEAEQGGPDLEVLENHLEENRDAPLQIGSFSAASNVTGILTDTGAVTRLLKKYGALSFWDYAGGGPYLEMDMGGTGSRSDGTAKKDAIMVSPHKFIGGPGASGILIVRNSAVRAHCPTWPGGGSVAYVSPWAHDYLGSVIEREEAGTPNILGDIRAALAFLVKEAIGQEWITRRERELVVRAQEVWGKNPAIRLFGRNVSRLPIFSFAVRDGKGGYIHHQLFTRMLSDLTGIQARGGCVCAGPYGHRLLDVTRQQSEAIRDAIRHGHEIEKPGWVRLNLGYLMDDATVSTIIEKVNWLATNASEYAGLYRGHDNDASFTFRGKTAPVQQLCGG